MPTVKSQLKYKYLQMGGGGGGGNFSNTDVESFNIDTCADNGNVNFSFYYCKFLYQMPEFEITKD